MSRQKSTWIRVGLVLALPLTVFAFGCAGGKSKISGTVTYKGSPLPGGSIVFRAENGKEYGSGIGKDGKYYADNVPTGIMKVYFNIPPADLTPGRSPMEKAHLAEGKEKNTKAPSGVPPEAQKAYSGAGAQQEKIPEIPAKYRSADTTPLSFEVKSGSNTYDVPLTD
jgi:hypothetical protein